MMRFLVGLVVIVLGATQVFAKDLSRLPSTWDGFYLGGSTAAVLMKGSSKDNTTKDILFDYEDHNSFQGLAFGGYEGFTRTHGNFLYGFEAGVEGSNVADDRKIGTKQIRYKTTVAYQGSARLRLGYVHDDFLVYATGGFAFAQINSEYWSTKHRYGSMLQPGWTVGAGVEYKLNQHWSTRIEYNFTDLGIDTIPKSIDPTWLCDKHITDHAVRIGVSYKF
jgi:outer membrane immunogenic protein